MDFQPSTYTAAAVAEGWLGRLDEAAERLPNRRVLVRATQLREASAALDDEGVFRALSEIVAMDLPDVTVRNEVDPRVLRFRDADDDAVRCAQRGDPIAGILFGRIAPILADRPAYDDDVRGPGFLARTPWRTGPAWLGGPRPEDAHLLCVPGGRELLAAVDQLVAWMTADSHLPVVIRKAMAHFQLSSISPVVHSGHLASLVISLGFVQAKVLRDQIVAPSLWFSWQNEKYRRAFTGLVDSGDIDSWVTFFAEGVVELCRSQIELIRRLEEIEQEQLAKLKRSDGLARLVKALIGNPVFNTELAVKLSGLGTRQVHNHIARLDRAQMVRKWGRDRLARKKGQQVVREVPAVVEAIAMLDHIPFRRDRQVFDE